MIRKICAVLSAVMLIVPFGGITFAAAEQGSVTADAEAGRYTWNFGYDENDSGKTVFDLADEYAELRISLGSGDSISANGIYWSTPSCNEPPTSAADSGRYIMLRTAYSGKVSLTINFTNASNNAKGRIWVNDMGTETSFDAADLSVLQKGVGTQLGSDFTGSYKATVSFDAEAGHLYTLHTYNRISYISEMYYTSEEIVGKTAAPVINAPIVEGDAVVSGTCAEGANVYVSINGGERQTAETDGTVWTLSGLTLAEGDTVAVYAQAGEYKESDPAETTVVSTDSVCSLTITGSEHGTVVSDQPNNGRIMKGTAVTLTVMPEDKYRLAQLTIEPQPESVEDVDESGSVSFVISGDTVVTAEFEAKPYRVITMPDSVENGTVAVKSGTVEENGVIKAVEGDTVTLVAEPEDGYRIKSLTYTDGNGDPVEIKYASSFTVPECDTAIAAEFKEEAVVSYVDTSFENYDRLTLTVDGEPFFYSGIQVRADNAIDKLGFSDEQVREMYMSAGADGFTVVNSQVRWTDVQPQTEIWAVETGILGGDASADAVTATDETAAYFTFDLPETETGVQYAAVKFRFRVSGVTADTAVSVYDATDGTLSGKKITASGWQGVTTARLQNTNDGSNGYFDINVADIVNAHNGGGRITLAVKCENSSKVTIYGAGSEGESRPQLKLSRDDVYDWTYLDKLLDNAYAAGVKFELLWFATDTCQQSHEERVPYYVHANYQKSLKADGTPARRLGADNIYIMCKNDMALRAKEKEVLETVFDHIAEYDAAKGYGHVVVGCQVANETAVGRLHSGTDDNKYFGHCYCETCIEKLAAASSETAFREETLWGYLDNLGSAVKESDYSVWTRQNNYMTTDTNVLAYNENKRSTEGTDLDFIGIDPYSITGGANHDYLYSFGHESCTYRNHTYNYAQGKNLPLVMEYGGNNQDLDESILACLAGGGYLNVYELLSGSEDFGTYVAVRDASGTATGFEPRTGYTYSSGSDVNWSETDWIERIRGLNGMFGKAERLLASKKPDGAGGTELLFFNPKSDGTTGAEKTLYEYGVTYNTENNGVGIAIGKSANEIVLLSSKAGGFVIDAENGIVSAESGYFDGDTWVSESAKTYEESTDGAVADMDAYECVLLTVGEAEEPDIYPVRLDVSLNDAGELTVSAEYTGEDTGELNGAVLAAAEYDNGALTKIQLFELSGAGAADVNGYTAAEDTELKLFVWDSAADMKPLSRVYAAQ